MRKEGYLMGWCTGGSRIVDLRGAYIHTYISSSIPPPHSQLSPSQKQQTNLNIPPFFFERIFLFAEARARVRGGRVKGGGHVHTYLVVVAKRSRSQLFLPNNYGHFFFGVWETPGKAPKNVDCGLFFRARLPNRRWRAFFFGAKRTGH